MDNKFSKGGWGSNLNESKTKRVFRQGEFMMKNTSKQIDLN